MPSLEGGLGEKQLRDPSPPRLLCSRQLSDLSFQPLSLSACGALLRPSLVLGSAGKCWGPQVIQSQALSSRNCGGTEGS